MNDVAVQILDEMDAALRLADTEWVIKAALVWGQRREHILAGEETWEDQNMGSPVIGGCW